MRSVTSFNDGWLFEGNQEVSLPHTAVELPFAYFDERSYQRPFTYSKTFTTDPAWTGKDVTLVFDGAMANAQVTINGEALGDQLRDWGRLLAQIGHHVARSSALNGQKTERQSLDEIRKGFDAMLPGNEPKLSVKVRRRSVH